MAWIIDHQKTALVILPISPEDIAKHVNNLTGGLAEKPPKFESAIALTLTDALISPLISLIHNTTLIIVPHGILNYLPFAVLSSNQEKQFLIEDYAIAYAPSVSALSSIRALQNPNENRLLALGNPRGDLLNAGSEVKAIAKSYPKATIFLREQATEDQIYAHAGRIDILHLSAHGVLQGRNPLFSSIELAPAVDGDPDGYLTVQEIYGLDLSGANLVVLSACKTARGGQSPGDEFIGLTRAFLYAGAPAVITTLWSVADDSTALLMESFYKHLQSGEPAVQALKQAQVKMVEEGYSPYQWVAFMLTGNDQE